MKRNEIRAMCLALALLPCFLQTNAQTDDGKAVNAREISAIDLKLDLAETKLELLDSKIRLWEDKPAVLERELLSLDQKISQLNFSPEQFNEKFTLLDSMLAEQQLMMAGQQAMLDLMNETGAAGSSGAAGTIRTGNQETLPVHQGSIPADDRYPSPIPQTKYVISIYPIRLFEGTMQLSLEWVLNRGNAIEISGMATYAAKEGLANYYLSNQKLDYYNASMDSYVPYESENISGYGTTLSWRNYLLPRTRPDYAAPRGIYAAPTLMYRRLTLTGFDYVINEETGNTEQVEVKQYLNIFSGGIQAGWQFVLWNAVTADVYVGGMVRLSKYDGEEQFTRYKEVRNIDFSGVMPTFGIKLGIVK